MDASPATPIGVELQTTIDLLHRLYLEVQAMESAQGAPDRVRDVLAAVRRQPNLERVPKLLLRIYAELSEALNGIRLTRETIQTYSVDRLRDTHARLSEVSNTTETVAMEMLNGLDRTLALIDRVQSESGEAARSAPQAFDDLRGEVNQLYGHLQFQDIVAQQLRGVGALLVEVERRVEAVAGLFDDPARLGGMVESPSTDSGPDTHSYNPDASMRDATGRQALIDAAFGAARDRPDSLEATPP